MKIFEVRSRHPLRHAVERHISDVYQQAFCAQVTHFAPRLFAMVDATGRVTGAAGVRSADEAFHAECYLDHPAEEVAATVLQRPIRRSDILEFTTLACARSADALSFVSQIVQLGRDAGCSLALFTGTAPLRSLLVRAGLTIVPIAAASRDRVTNPHEWGRYYDTGPIVCVAPDSPGVPTVLRGPRFSSLQVPAMKPVPAGMAA